MNKTSQNLTKFVLWIGESSLIALIFWCLRKIITWSNGKATGAAGDFFTWIEGVSNISILENFLQLLVLTFFISFAKWALPISKL